jgi:hypothetical protein
MATTMAAAMAATSAAVAAMKTMAGTAREGGRDNNQLIGALKEIKMAETATRTETETAMETAKMTGKITMPMTTTTTVHRQQQQGQHTRDVPCYGGGGSNVSGIFLTATSTKGQGNGVVFSRKAYPRHVVVVAIVNSLLLALALASTLLSSLSRSLFPLP